MALPAGPVGTHLGHIVNAFTDTPNRQALLATALTEARTAAQHAQLASRQPANLDYMKTHVNHVINVLDPIIVTAGPGLGYGVKRAASGVAGHIEAAAATAGASANVQMHAKHIATCSRNAVQRAESIITLGQRVLGATTAQEAAAQSPAVPMSRAEITYSFAPVVKKAQPAVVNVFASRVERMPANPFLDDPIFRRFFGDQQFALFRFQYRRRLFALMDFFLQIFLFQGQ